MKFKEIDHVKIGFVFFLVIFTVSAILILAIKNIRYPDVRGTNAYPLNFGWYYEVDGEKHSVQLPCTIPKEAVKNGTVYLYHPVTVDIAGKSLGFFSEKQTVRVAVNGVQLYNWQRQGAPAWLKTYGWLLHIVDIPLSSREMTVCVSLKAEVPGAEGVCSEMCIGTRSEIMNLMLKRYQAQGIIACVIEVIGLFLLFLYVCFRKMFTKDRTIFVLALLSIAAGLWQLEESKIFYVFCPNPMVHWVCDYMMFLTMPPLIVALSEEMTGCHSDILFHMLFWLALIMSIVECVLQFCGILTFTQMLLPIQVLVVVTCVYVLIKTVIGIKQNNKKTKIYLPAVVILVVGIVGEFIYYYIYKSASAVFFGLTLLPFFIYLGVNAYRESSKRFHDAEQSAIYHNLAFTDFSTGVLSRTAYYDYMDHCTFDSEYDLYVFDLNNLKIINDTYGHLVGDKVIKVFAECASKAFEKTGTVYRAGGDEFVVVCRNAKPEELLQNEQTFLKLAASRKDIPVELSASYGSAHFIPETRDDFFYAQKEADSLMYKMKRKYHLAHGDRRSR